MEKNKIIKLNITGMTSQGSGVGHIMHGKDKGMAVFVPLTAVGDEIFCQILNVQKNYAYGKINNIVKPSPHRTQSQECSVFGKCGGCTYRHISYESELEYKKQWISDCLRRIGKLNINVEKIIPSPRIDRYRNKAQYPVGVSTNNHRHSDIGFFAPRSNRIVHNKNCLLHPEVFHLIVKAIDDWMTKYNIQPYDRQSGKNTDEQQNALLRHIYIRKAYNNEKNQIMVCLVCTSGKVAYIENLIESLTNNFPEITSIMINTNDKNTNVILGENEFSVFGKDYITDTLCGYDFRLSTASFYQVNHGSAQNLYELIKEVANLDSSQTLLDLYCGTGTISLTLASSVRQVVGIDISHSAINDANINAVANNISNAKFIQGDASKLADKLKKQKFKTDIVVIDPPRKGCDKLLISTIAKFNPKIILYVSCNPATLSRDLAVFSDKGFEAKQVIGVDMFPRTANVECLAKLVNTN